MNTIYHDTQYTNLVNNILTNGYRKQNRTGEDTIGLFGTRMEFDLSDRTIPLLTTKLVHTKSIIYELLWFISGSTDVNELQKNGVSIWDEWQLEDGTIGPGYGHQWRNWETFRLVKSDWPEEQLPSGEPYYISDQPIDQIQDVIKTLRTNPDSRRIIVSAWNVANIDNMALPPCHCLFQFNSRLATIQELDTEAMLQGKATVMLRGKEWGSVDDNSWYNSPEDYFKAIGIPLRKLDCQLYQRSCDVGLGVPFNVAQYSMLVPMIAQITNHIPGKFIWVGGDTHIYNNHIEGLQEQIKRTPYPSPKLYLNKAVENIDNFVYNDFTISKYEHHPHIKFDVAV